MNQEINKIIEEIKSYENEEMCMILLSQKQNKALLKYITNLQQENKQLNRKIDTLAFWINETINTIEEQSTGNDEYILTRLYSFMSILGDKE